VGAAVSADRTIAALNDAFRLRLGLQTGIPGRTMMTRAVAALPGDQQLAILRAVRAFDRFTPDNDPHREHDFGRFAVDGVDEPIIFKIDYYADDAMEFGSEDASDPAQSYRVLTIMLASDY